MQPPFRPFEMWRDYLGLGALLVRLCRDATAAAAVAPAPAAPAPAAEPAPAPAPAAAAAAAPARPPLCAFCRQNGEARHVYTGHNLHDASGRVECPVLRRYVCPQCGATRDNAHTRRFCPLTREGYVSVYHHARRRRRRF